MKTRVSVTPERVTTAAIESFVGCKDPRLRSIMQSLVRHLHAFATEVQLTESEWAAAMRVLRETGDITDDQRQEFILWSDALGLSMLVDALGHSGTAGATESTIRGPFWVADSPYRAYGESISEQDAGIPAWVHGGVLDIDGRPIAGAEIDVWQNGPNRLYAVQDPNLPETHLRGRFVSRDDGSYAFLALRPTPYPIPDDGPVGRMLAATGRHPWRPAHIHLIVTAAGYRQLTTHIFDAESPYLDSDAVFAVKPSLLRRFIRRSAEDTQRPKGINGEWYSVENDIVLAPLQGR